MVKINNNFEITPDSLLGQKTLITGETGSGKTISTFLFFVYLLEQNHYRPEEITILDFGPPKVHSEGAEFAGTLSDCLSLIQQAMVIDNPTIKRLKGISPFHWTIERQNPYLTPRYSASDAEAVISACCRNFEQSSHELETFILNPTKVLIINDLGIYMHLGGLQRVIKACRCAETVLMNAYLGQNLLGDYGSHISSREKKILLRLGNTDKIRHSQITSVPIEFIKKYPEIYDILTAS